MKDNLKDLIKWEKELQKCKDSPAYFYNTYFRKEGQKEYTDQEWQEVVEMSRMAHLKPRLKAYPLKPSECTPNKESN